MLDSINGINALGVAELTNWEMRRDEDLYSLPEEVQEQVNLHADEFRSHEELVAFIRNLAKQVGIPANLRVLGVKPEDFEIMAEHAMQDACMATNPRIATKEQIIELYRRAYEGE